MDEALGRRATGPAAPTSWDTPDRTGGTPVDLRLILRVEDRQTPPHMEIAGSATPLEGKTPMSHSQMRHAHAGAVCGLAWSLEPRMSPLGVITMRWRHLGPTDHLTHEC